MESVRARADLEAARQERGKRAAEAARLKEQAARADANLKALKDAVEKGEQERVRLAAEAEKAQKLADQADALVVSRELLVKAADAAQGVADAETQLGIAKARKAPDGDIQRLQAAVDKARAAAPPQADVDKAVEAAKASDAQLQRERDQTQLGQQIADLEAKKLNAEQAAKDAQATVQKAKAGADEAAAAVNGLSSQLDKAKEQLKALETPAVPTGGGTGGGAAGGPTTTAPAATP